VMAASSGTVYQDLTVTRSVNGIVKSHANNEEVHLFSPVKWGL
jgi:hypothetical protein